MILELFNENFLKKINKNGPSPEYNKSLGNCWIWTGATLKGGYGVYSGTTAHRFSYQIVNGKIENKKMHVDHLCRVRNCVNPEHLELVTAKENYIRGFGWSGINHRKTHCPKGHLLSEENNAETKYGRKCRICNLSRVKTKGKQKYWENIEEGRRISREKSRRRRERIKNANKK